MKEDKEVREGVGKVKESGRKKNMKRLSRGNVRTPFRMRPLTFSAKVKFQSAIRAMLTLTVGQGRWSIALVSSDIYVPPSFAVEVVGVGEMSDSGWEFGSECGSVAVSGVPVVPEVVETTPSVVTVMCEGVPSDSEQGFVLKAPSCLERRMKTPLPQQSSFSSVEEGSPWSTQERTADAKMEQYVNNRDCKNWRSTRWRSTSWGSNSRTST